MSHVVLHMTLCRAALAAPADQPLPVHVQLRFERGDPIFDKTLSATRGSAGDATVELDAPRGQEALIVEIPKYRCSADDIVTFLTDQNRKLNETLVDGPDTRPLPTMLFSGAAPITFLYTTKPTFVALDKSVACKAPVQQPIPLKIATVYDSGAYYLSIYPDPTLAAQQPVFALRLMTPTGLAHYIHIDLPPPPLQGWPANITMPVTEDMVDEIVTDPPGTLSCPKLWRTSVH